MATTSEPPNGLWRRYGAALVHSMADVQSEVPDDLHPVLLETADYWLSLGLALAINRPEDARRLLSVIEAEENERSELESDAAAFVQEAFG